MVASNMVVNIVGGGLVVLGLVLVVVTLSFWRSAVEDPEVLAPLEVMGDRRFARAGDERRVEILNQVRPTGEESVARAEAPPVPGLKRVSSAGTSRVSKWPLPKRKSVS